MSVACARCGEQHPTFRESVACIYQDHLSQDQVNNAMDRVDARLGGATHEEARAMYPNVRHSEHKEG